MAGGGDSGYRAATTKGTRSLTTAVALVFGFRCGVTSGVSWEYLVDLLP